MPIRITNRTIYTGRVGAPMRPRAIPRPSRRVHRKAIRLVGGPLNGCRVRLDAEGDGHTLPLVVRGQAGRYQKGLWIADRVGFCASVC